MTVVKLGGSYAFLPELQQWLDAIEARAGRVVIVPGGGPFADTVRSAQPRMGFGESAAHEMALLAMTQYGIALTARSAALVLAASIAALHEALAQGRVPVWSPWPMLHNAPDISPSWEVTSDSLALWFAGLVGAPCVLLVKSRPPPADPTASELVASGLVDGAFAHFAAAYRGTVYVAGPGDAPRALQADEPPGRRIIRARASRA